MGDQKKSSFSIGAAKGNRKLFGMAHPGLVRPFEDDLQFLLENGVGALVTLTEDELFLPLPYRKLFHQLHLPIENLEPPTLKQIIRFVKFVDDEFVRGVNVAVHCLIGVGRTGTLIASYRVSMGEEPYDAISNLRKKRRAIETEEQGEMVYEYHRFLKKQKWWNLLFFKKKR
jgi:atypical dual specificity phosphatase